MAGRTVVDSERCKGCSLCVNACPRDCLGVSKESNKKGYFPAQTLHATCTGCAFCALVCPDAAISVYRKSRIQEIKPTYQRPAALQRENT